MANYSIFELLEDIFSQAVSRKASRNYIIALLFIKIVNDIFDAEVLRIMQQESCTRETAEFLCKHNKIAIPQGAGWKDIFKTDSSIGFTVNNALKLIEEYNPLIKSEFSSLCPLWPIDCVVKQAIELLNDYKFEQDSGILDILKGEKEFNEFLQLIHDFPI